MGLKYMCVSKDLTMNLSEHLYLANINKHFQIDPYYWVMTLGLLWAHSMPSPDEISATWLAEARWRCDNMHACSFSWWPFTFADDFLFALPMSLSVLVVANYISCTWSNLVILSHSMYKMMHLLGSTHLKKKKKGEILTYRVPTFCRVDAI